MTGHHGPHRHLSRFSITDLTHQNDIRILTQHRFKDRIKTSPAALIYLYLANTLQLILHWVLCCHDIDIGLVQPCKQRIEAGRFTRACRAGEQDQAFRLATNLAQRLLIAHRKAERLKREVPPLIKQTYNQTTVVMAR